LNSKNPAMPNSPARRLKMTLSLVKTKAEQAVSEAFEAASPDLPGNAQVKAARSKAIGQFGALGLPHRRIEEWKYTDLRALIKDAGPATRAGAAGEAASAEFLNTVTADTYVFTDGKLTSSPDAKKAQAGVTVEALATSLAASPDALTLDLPDTIDAGAKSVVALNSAFVSDGAVMRIAAGADIKRPLHLLFISTGNTSVRNSIVVGAKATATVIETHIATGNDARHENAMTTIAIEDGATLHHATITEAAGGTVYLGNTIARLAANTTYKPFQLTSGQGLVRHQMTVTFAGENGTFDLGAAALANAGGHFDTTMVIDHAVPHCTSRELFKCVLDGRARGIFQGKVIVRPDAQKTDGKQMAQALMLSPDAEFDSKPELEIYADDVVCGHGTTTMELDKDLMFYCMSRGIPEAEARALLIESFIGEAIDKVEHEDLRAALLTYAMGWLNTARS
jgi:Fe-S cluster assembly protein SufD